MALFSMCVYHVFIPMSKLHNTKNRGCVALCPSLRRKPQDENLMKTNIFGENEYFEIKWAFLRLFAGHNRDLRGD